MGEGQTFAQFVAGIERLRIQFAFQQVDGNVPIEHTHIMASRWGWLLGDRHQRRAVQPIHDRQSARTGPGRANGSRP